MPYFFSDISYNPYRLSACNRGIFMLQIYWGHGRYGIISASIFYFGKHPSLLSLGESAMLAGTIPAPELCSPLRDPSRSGTTIYVLILLLVTTPLWNCIYCIALIFALCSWFLLCLL